MAPSTKDGTQPRLIAENNLISLAEDHGKICTALGIKITRGGEVVQIAKAAGYDSLFIDLEHPCMSVQDASQMCIAAIASGITPFVRVSRGVRDALWTSVMTIDWLKLEELERPFVFIIRPISRQLMRSN